MTIQEVKNAQISGAGSANSAALLLTEVIDGSPRQIVILKQFSFGEITMSLLLFLLVCIEGYKMLSKVFSKPITYRK